MAGVGAVLLGVAGFCAGFFGPMLLNPEANQGPLVGILITGPGGAILGAILGALLGALGLQGSTIAKCLLGTAMVGSVAVLFFVLPQPKFIGNVVEAEVVDCASPVALKAEALAYWDKRIAAAPWAPPRPNWKENFEAMVAADPGVVVNVKVKRHVGLYQNRKPWNKGTFSGGQAWWVKDRYFVGGATCEDWPAGKTGLYAAQGEKRGSKAWPSEVLPNFLDLQVLSPAGAEQVALLK